MNSDDAKELVRNYLETYQTNANILIDFIQQQDKMLEKACLMIAEHEDCPLDAIGVRKYLQSEVGK